MSLENSSVVQHLPGKCSGLCLILSKPKWKWKYHSNGYEGSWVDLFVLSIYTYQGLLRLGRTQEEPTTLWSSQLASQSISVAIFWLRCIFMLQESLLYNITLNLHKFSSSSQCPNWLYLIDDALCRQIHWSAMFTLSSMSPGRFP
jgi:hypothetical protein